MLSLLQSPRFDKLWEGSFVKPFGSLEVPFGVLMRYSFNGRKLGQQYQEGYKIRTSHRAKVHAANGGVVIFSDHLGVYGRMVAMDHGLGLVSLYGRLGEVTVSEGDQVSKGAHIAYAGQTGFATSPQVYFEMRVQGVPVNPREWLDRAWVDAHVDGKINDCLLYTSPSPRD